MQSELDQKIRKLQDHIDTIEWRPVNQREEWDAHYWNVSNGVPQLRQELEELLEKRSKNRLTESLSQNNT